MRPFRSALIVLQVAYLGLKRVHDWRSREEIVSDITHFIFDMSFFMPTTWVTDLNITTIMNGET